MHVIIKTPNFEAEQGISTYAADLVRLGFDPSELGRVHVLKALTAALISCCEDLRGPNPQSARHASLAITAAEEAASWAVKAATAPHPEGGT